MSRGWACVARYGGIGDNLIASSVLSGLRARHGKLEVISRAPAASVFENNPHIDKLTVWPANEAPTDATEWSKVMRKRAAEYDYFIDLSHSVETSLCFMEGQFQFNWPDHARRLVANNSYLGFAHDLCNLEHDYAPMFYPTADERSDALNNVHSRRRDNYMIGWCLSGSRVDKVYPYSHFAIARLITELGASVMLFGAPGKDFELARQIEQMVLTINGSTDRLHLALSNNTEAPNWPIRRNLAHIQACDLIVSPDTGPAWAVAMLPMPKVILLSHASALNITHGWVNTTALHADQGRVSCWPCHKLHPSLDTCRKAAHVDAAACMADISVESVVASVRSGLMQIQKELSCGER